MPLRLGASKKTTSMTKVVKEDKLYDQAYRGLASRGLQSPFLPVPLRGTPLLPNHSPGLQSWVVLRAGRKSSKKTTSMTRVVKADKVYMEVPPSRWRIWPVMKLD